MNNQLQHIEQHNKEHKYRTFYKKINIDRKGDIPKTTMGTDKNKTLLNNREDVLIPWLEYFENHLKQNIDNKYETSYTEEGEETNNEELTTIKEVDDAIKKLANHKTSGSDKILSEELA